MPLAFYVESEEAGDEDLHADEDQDDAAGEIGLARKANAHLLADAQTGNADDEGHRSDHHRCQRGSQKIILGNGKAHGKGVDGGGDTLHQQRAEAKGFVAFLAAAVVDAVQQHFDADVAQKCQRDPRDQLFKAGEKLHDGVDAGPAQQRHQALKNAENAGNTQKLAPFHLRFVQTVGQRDGKRVHGQTHAQQYAVKEKHKIQFHTILRT